MEPIRRDEQNRGPGSFWEWFVRRQYVVIPLILLAGLLGAEIWLHLKPLPPYVTDLLWIQAADMGLHRPSDDPRMLVELIPGAHDVFRPADGPAREVTVNSLGLRDPERTLIKPDGAYRLLIVGSSTTYGAAVSDGDTLSAHLERLLNRRFGGDALRFEVWNGGVSAYTPMQMAALADRLVEEGAAPDVVLFQVHLLGRRAF
ncbi:MAG: hypothetical protein M5R36_03815 [Deltaproteobacteria bacterium]|nr:hypothetical protein [Deltaproteobacteria bacterium]